MYTPDDPESALAEWTGEECFAEDADKEIFLDVFWPLKFPSVAGSHPFVPGTEFLDFKELTLGDELT